MIKFRKAQTRDKNHQRTCGRFIFKARSPTQTMNALDEYLRSLGDKPARWLAREVRSWGNEFSYSELAAAIEAGNLDDLIDWQERYADIVNEKFAPMWAAAIAEASKKATRGMTVLSDSNDYVRGWINTHGGELITRLSTESRLAIMNVIFRGQGLRMAPRDVAKEIRPLIGLNDRQAAANQKYKQEIYNRYLERGMSESKAAERAEQAALKYAGKQHRYRAETIVLTENAFAYNRGAHMSVCQSIADGYMGRCAMIWTTAGTNRVCSRCLALKDTVVGYTDELGVLLPPLHPRCRCAIMYDEVGTPRATRPKPTINPLLPAAVSTEIISPATPEPQTEPKTYREFKTADEVKEYFGSAPTDKNSIFGLWYSKLTAEEEKALIDYTGRGYIEINGLLRGTLKETWLDEEELQRLKKTARLIEDALNKSELADDILVYRRVGLRTLFRLKSAQNGVFREKAFTSTSLIRDNFVGDVEIEIKVGKGKGVGAFLEPLSKNHGENEFLLNRGATFRIIKINEEARRIEVELINHDAQFLDKIKQEKNQKVKARQLYAQTHKDKFNWEIEDLEILSENGNWIRGDEFLNRK